MNVIVVAVVCVIATVVLKWILKVLLNTHKLWRTLSQVPGPKAHWLYGVDVGSVEEYIPTLTKISKQFPNMCSLWYHIANGTLLVNSPVTIKEFLKQSVTKEMAVHTFFKEWTGPGLLYSNGNYWARNRKLLTPAFHFKILQSYTSVYNSCIDTLIDKWEQRAKEGQPFEVFSDLSLCTFDVILQCACSIKLHPQTSGSRHRFLLVSYENSALCEGRIFNLLHQMDFFYKLTATGRKFYSNVKYSRQFAKEVIVKRKAAVAEQGDSQDDDKGKKLDFLDIMLAAKDSDGVGMTVDEMVNEVITFLFAGHDTTATALSWLFYCLATNPECQQKCHQEIDQVLGDRTDIVWEDFAALPYTTLCIKESLRIHTTVPIVGMTTGEDITVDGITIPAGIDIEVPTYLYHHDPRWWKDPEKFDPLRFTAENSKGREPYAYIPFSLGTRNCIGQNFAMQELKAVAMKVLQRFEITTEMKSYKHLATGVLQCKGGIWIALKERK